MSAIVLKARVFDIVLKARASGTTVSRGKASIPACAGTGPLGYRFEAGRRSVRTKSMDKLKDRIREKTGRCRGVSLERVIADLNPVLRGWFGYFKQAHPTTFADVDGFIRHASGMRPA